MSKKTKKNEGLRQALQAFSVLGGIGIYFCIIVGICVFLGDYLDRAFNFGHYGKLVGILFGFPIGIYSVYKRLKELS